MLRLKQNAGDFMLDDIGTKESILISHDIAVEIKNESRTPSELEKKLYEKFGHQPKYKKILDRNLKRPKGVSSPTGMHKGSTMVRNNAQLVFDDFQRVAR